MAYYVGTDIGGTFTDLVMLDDTGDVTIVKAPTTPDDRTRGVLDAFTLAAEAKGLTRDKLISQLAYFAHGTTAATNAFIERKGVKTGLLTTRGFRDTLRIQRCMASWAGLSDHEIAHFSERSTPQPLVDIDLIEPIIERIDYKGAVVVPLDEEAARASIKRLVDAGVEAIAVTLLWSFRNPAHERRLAELVNEIAPGVFVTISSSLIPVLGEYERTSTTCINSYLGPVINRYINGLENSIRTAGFDGPISIMESGGGVLPANEAAFQAANLLTSGPAGGVLASLKLGEQLGYDNILTTDMGGTSFDVGVIVNGRPLLENIREVGRFHVALPSIKVTAIGAGGGSIARIHAGHLMVGPESAGAVPGPACYRRGGTEPTITDADVVLGMIDPAYFLGGKMDLDIAASERAINDHIAKPLGLSLHEAAAGIREVANNQMADLLRRVTTRSGYDPRNFVVFAYGGAGPTHAYHYSSVAGISTVVVPKTASGHSAFGTVTADRHRSFSLAFGQHAPARFKRASDHIDAGKLNAGFDQLVAQCRKALGDKTQIKRLIGMRFRQQVHQIEVDVPSTPLDAAAIDQLVDSFEQRYEQIYGKGTALRMSGVEFITLRVEGLTPVQRPDPRAREGGGAAPKIAGTRKVYFYGEGFKETPVYRWEDLSPGHPVKGPAIVERPDTTIVVGVGHRAEIEPFGNLLIHLKG
ncbi:hydantoinase/oxoprolinase family protein [Methylocella sp. CPCC 101449]|uniref:hydantoinase/oxoprolinase family protein n=1 Tax=Methylocella sp. CPCC 101449 TaxID=2987531 RepID=UPI00289106EE|nr:hydantoinase/oxoprolinase family protein [Methylocella sp. CPCC 101449]MDT2020045.1 hydantoinase/oxoprolinase family protein [Methylocella sp. CPCC 101449]